jgi:hypothetical protein
MMRFQPESFLQNRQRFPDALKPVYKLHLVQAGLDPVPGTLRKHVFDFLNGVRLILSVDQVNDEPPTVHWSFGLAGGKPTVEIPDVYALQTFARALIKEWWTEDEPVETQQTRKAYHLWFAVRNLPHGA